MKATTDNLALLFKSLWGASTVPFCAGAQPAFSYPEFEALSAKISQLCAIGSSGVLHGPNGSGKSYLINYLLESKLSQKQFKVLLLAHSSLTGSDLLRALSLELEIRPKFRRSDTVAEITTAWKTLGNRWPVLIVEEAQNLSAAALEELRLLSCAKLDKVPFSLVLVGDNGLLASLKLGVHAPLRSRLSILPATLASQCPAKSPIPRKRLAERQHPPQPLPARGAGTTDPGQRRATPNH